MMPPKRLRDPVMNELNGAGPPKATVLKTLSLRIHLVSIPRRNKWKSGKALCLGRSRAQWVVVTAIWTPF